MSGLVAGVAASGDPQWPLRPEAYEPKEAVGVSKHGIVRRAWCPALEAEVAIKVVNLDTLVGEGEVDELHKQTTLLSGMAHGVGAQPLVNLAALIPVGHERAGRCRPQLHVPAQPALWIRQRPTAATLQDAPAQRTISGRSAAPPGRRPHRSTAAPRARRCCRSGDDHLGFGRVVVSEREVPYVSVNLV